MLASIARVRNSILDKGPRHTKDVNNGTSEALAVSQKSNSNNTIFEDIVSNKFLH